MKRLGVNIDHIATLRNARGEHHPDPTTAAKFVKKVLNLKKLSKINFISNGDDYQVLFTASKNKRRIIRNISSKYRIKLTKIGFIQRVGIKPSIIDHKNMKIAVKNKGYRHQF